VGPCCLGLWQREARADIAPAACRLQDGDESAAGVLASLLLLPDDFQPANRRQAHNSCVHRAMGSSEVQVRDSVLGARSDVLACAPC
jgi:hypothetical protein